MRYREIQHIFSEPLNHYEKNPPFTNVKPGGGWIPSRFALQDDFNDSVSEKRPVLTGRFRERTDFRIRILINLAVPVSYFLGSFGSAPKSTLVFLPSKRARVFRGRPKQRMKPVASFWSYMSTSVNPPRPMS